MRHYQPPDLFRLRARANPAQCIAKPEYLSKSFRLNIFNKFRIHIYHGKENSANPGQNLNNAITIK